MQKRSIMKRFLGIFYPKHQSKVGSRTCSELVQPLTVKKLGPGEVVVIKGCRIVEICNMYGIKRLM
jgi:hypothetical protein